jgi:hypothetical protein
VLNSVKNRADRANVTNLDGAPSNRHKRQLSYGAALSVVSAAYLALLMPVMGMRLSAHHGWRQTQTADTTRILARTGFDVFHPRVSVFGPRATLVYELPWFQTIAALLTKIGVPLIVALRGTSMVFSVLTALGVAGLTRRLAGERAAVWAAVLYLFNPMTFAWGRTSLIESFTTAVAVAWVLGAWRVRTLLNSGETVSHSTWFRFATLPMGLGIVTATSKFTTALPWAIVVLAVLFQPRLRTAFTSAVAVGVPMISGVIWTAWADHLKNQSVLSQMESSTVTRRQLFRPLSERASIDAWGILGVRSLMFVGVVGLIWLTTGAVSMLMRPQRLVNTAVLLVPFTAPFIFFGLYQVHDYYQMAIIPALAVVLGIGAHEVHEKFSRNPVALVGLLSAHIVGFFLVGGVTFVQTQLPSGYAPKSELAATTYASEQVLGVGQGWNPQPFFEADRQGYLIGIGPKPDALIPLLDSDLGSPHALWAARPMAPTVAEFLKHFPRIAVVGEQTYRFGNQPIDLQSGPVAPIVTWESSQMQSNPAMTPPEQTMRTVNCDGLPHTIAPPRQGLTVMVDRPVWLQTESTSAALPIRSGTLTSRRPITSVSCVAVDGDDAVAELG